MVENAVRVCVLEFLESSGLGIRLFKKNLPFFSLYIFIFCLSSVYEKLEPKQKPNFISNLFQDGEGVAPVAGRDLGANTGLFGERRGFGEFSSSFSSHFSFLFLFPPRNSRNEIKGVPGDTRARLLSGANVGERFGTPGPTSYAGPVRPSPSRRPSHFWTYL